MDDTSKSKPVAFAGGGICAGIGTEIGLACHRRFFSSSKIENWIARDTRWSFSRFRRDNKNTKNDGPHGAISSVRRETIYK